MGVIEARVKLVSAFLDYLKELEAAAKPEPEPEPKPEPEPEPKPVPPKPQTSKRLFHYNSEDIVSVPDYEAWRKARRPTMNSRIFQLKPGSRIYSNDGDWSPAIDSGVLSAVTPVTVPGNDRAHNEWTPYCAPDLLHGTYLRLNTKYALCFRSRVLFHDPASWVSIFQCWGPSHSNWTGYDSSNGKNPPLSLMVFKGKWHVQSYGAPKAGLRSDWLNHSVSLDAADNLWHQWDILYTPSVDASLAFLEIRRDGKTVFFHDSPNCLLHQSRGPQPRFGAYSYSRSLVEIEEIEVSQLS